MECPEEIAWLDLSFNEIQEVTGDILEYVDISDFMNKITRSILSRFPNLKMIYLHGNRIASLADLNRLTLLPNLYSLTLHG